jgi:hypothetical protein
MSRSTSDLSRKAATSSSTSDVNKMQSPPRRAKPKHDPIAIMKLVTAAGVDLHNPCNSASQYLVMREL